MVIYFNGANTRSPWWARNSKAHIIHYVGKSLIFQLIFKKRNYF